MLQLLVDQLTKLSASEDVVVIETATKLLNELLVSQCAWVGNTKMLPS